MNEISIPDFDPELVQIMQAIAAEKNISLNQAMVYLLRQGARLSASSAGSGSDDIDSLDEFIGTWTEQDEQKFLQSIQSCEQVDPDFWR